MHNKDDTTSPLTPDENRQTIAKMASINWIKCFGQCVSMTEVIGDSGVA